VFFFFQTDIYSNQQKSTKFAKSFTTIEQ